MNTAPSVIVLKIVNIACVRSLRSTRVKLTIFDIMLIGALFTIYLSLRFRKIKSKSILYLRGAQIISNFVACVRDSRRVSERSGDLFEP